MRPCPFCAAEGGGLQLIPLVDAKGATMGNAIRCSSCGASGPVCDTAVEAVCAWADRAAPVAAQVAS